jgi:hypothetical protein
MDKVPGQVGIRTLRLSGSSGMGVWIRGFVAICPLLRRKRGVPVAVLVKCASWTCAKTVVHGPVLRAGMETEIDPCPVTQYHDHYDGNGH